ARLRAGIEGNRRPHRRGARIGPRRCSAGLLARGPCAGRASAPARAARRHRARTGPPLARGPPRTPGGSEPLVLVVHALSRRGHTARAGLAEPWSEGRALPRTG